jgi:DNA-binding Xre family transcriptional regulator
MKKPKSPQTPRWIANLRTHMEARRYNPRSLSLKAGLNATAVRDMLEGRTRFPRYDTVLALCEALEVTPSALMGGAPEGAPATAAPHQRDEAETSTPHEPQAPKILRETPENATGDDLELLTEIITRLQEVAEDYQHELNPRDFAAMVTTIYHRTRQPAPRKSRFENSLSPKIHDLVAYEALRRRSRS